MRTRVLLAASLAASLALTGCYSLKIGQINADPTRWSNRHVSVEGVVTNSFGALGAGGYQIDDGTGRIVVITSGR
ncbi:MAG: hypothetical protein HYR60_20645, partial [Acidobacteria bacterium]|nr:hypothetical protein [Acidobacteriota bacterium]